MLGFDIGPMGLLFVVLVVGLGIFVGLKVHRRQQFRITKTTTREPLK